MQPGPSSGARFGLSRLRIRGPAEADTPVDAPLAQPARLGEKRMTASDPKSVRGWTTSSFARRAP